MVEICDVTSENGQYRYIVSASRVRGPLPGQDQHYFRVDIFKHIRADMWREVKAFYPRTSEADAELAAAIAWPILDREGIDEAHIEAKLTEAERLAGKAKEPAGA